MRSQSMTARERRAAFSLAGIFSLRMMGLFMILPVFSLYAENLKGAVPVLVGLAIGAYGLTQALLQIPFGMLSDRLGRKPVIIFGLILFCIGSVVAAMADSIGAIILGRAMQGAGAIAAAVMALAADLTREEHRSRIMATIGMSIGLSFAVSLVMGPLLAQWIGVNGIFWLTSILALLGVLVVIFAVPTPERRVFHRDAESKAAFFADVLANPQLLRLDAGVFTLHMVLTASFVALPFALRDVAGLDPARHWEVYLPVMLISLFLMFPAVIVAEKHRRIKQVFVAAIAGIVCAELGLMFFHDSLTGIIIALLLYFIAFNVLEALLPSMISKFSPPERKGTAMGVYSTSQFLGAFAGGVSGGALYGSSGLSGVFMFCAIAGLVWLALAQTMKEPRYLSDYLLHVGELDERQQQDTLARLRQMTGVAEVALVAEEGTAYLKIDRRETDIEALERMSTYWDGDAERPASGSGLDQDDRMTSHS